VSSRLIAGLLFGSLCLAANVSLLYAQAAPIGRVRVTILYSRHLGAHGLGYNDRSLLELSQKLSPADVPSMMTLLADLQSSSRRPVCPGLAVWRQHPAGRRRRQASRDELS
jgi:hypothetical protein